MYFNIRLWAFTEGVRLRIGATVALGVLAALVGVARLAALGWLPLPKGGYPAIWWDGKSPVRLLFKGRFVCLLKKIAYFRC